MRKRPLFFLLLAGFVLLGWSCAESEIREKINTAPALSRTVTDGLGRSVTLSSRPSRVVSLAPNLTEWVYALGAESVLVARSQACDFPERAAEKPEAPTWPRIDLEQLIAYRPDLILVTDEIFSRDDIALIEQSGAPVFVQTFPNLNSLFDAAETLGDLLGKAERGKSLADSLRALKNRVQSATQNQIRYPVLLLVSENPLKSVGNSSILHSLIELSGGKNVFEKLDTPYPAVTVEDILYAAPEYVILPSEDTRAYARMLSAYPMLANTPADATRRVFVVNPDLFFRPGPRMLEGLLQLTHILHSALTPDSFLDAP